MSGTNITTHVPLPLGELTELEGGRVRVVMPLNARTRGLVQLTMAMAEFQLC